MFVCVCVCGGGGSVFGDFMAELGKLGATQMKFEMNTEQYIEIYCN